MYEILDRIINIDYGQRGIEQLYLAARKRFGNPLCELAVNMIMDIPKERYVFLSTGSVTRSWVSTLIGETDGPLGTAVLANVIRVSRSAIPIILTEETLVEPTKAVVRAAGLCIVNPVQAKRAIEMKAGGNTAVACVLPFASNDTDAEVTSKELIKEMNPAAIICIEKADRNEKGIYHNMMGYDYSNSRARVDILVKEAKKRGIPTIGIGDGGNEIGMACVVDAVKKYIPYGNKCQCPCLAGIASSTETDLLVTGVVSNWVCYIICAALAYKLRDTDLLHTGQSEKRLLEVAISNGLIDGVTGEARPTVDGYSLVANYSIIEFIRSIVSKNIRKIKKGENKY